MYKIVAEIVKSGNAEELIKIIKQYEIDVSKRKENKKNDRI
jgi:hypothetical protein